MAIYEYMRQKGEIALDIVNSQMLEITEPPEPEFEEDEDL